MEVVFATDKIQFGLYELFDALSPEQKREVAERLVWDDDLFSEFVDRLVGQRVVTDSFDCHIHRARLELVERMPEAARNLIRSLLHMVDSERADARRHSKWAWEMYHAWGERRCHECSARVGGFAPDAPPFERTAWADDAAIDRLLREAKP